tara:strand:- start:3691 stop:4002 length:312 start_codon:yes stop_codon:yes gene_type:complete
MNYVIEFDSPIASAIEDLDCEEKLYANYSGRYMYGKTCIGIVGDDVHSDLIQFISSIVSLVDKEELEEILEYFSDCKMDNMGLNSILYFPNVQLSEEFLKQIR